MSPPRNKPLIVSAVLGALVAVLLLAQYADSQYKALDLRRRAEAMTGGNAQRGKVAIARYGCGGCHTVTGAPQAGGRVGPPLDGFGARAMIAGKLENKPENLMLWIRNPQQVTPGTAMPNLGVTPQDSRDLAAFLYTRT